MQRWQEVTGMKAVCVFCGSNVGRNPAYEQAAVAVGTALAKADLKLVYGGGKVGLMGVIADEVLRLGGEVTGVIPTQLVEREVGHNGLTRQFIVKDMHERKAMMAQLADGFIAMPGGMGTLEELFEMLTWSQLGIHQKPIGLLNVDGFYASLAAFIQHAGAQGFIRSEHVQLMRVEADPAELLRRLKA
jgi:uncharacterized protein (TIGR00730 family)